VNHGWPPGRSAAIAGEMMIATAHPQATLTGLDVLRSGGNAMDAAVAAAAMLAVVEPAMSGIGGDCFAIFTPGDGEVRAFNGSGRAPYSADVAALAELGVTTIERHSAHAVTVPGAVAAWERLLADHGTRSLGDLLRPAIAAALEGFIVTPRVAFDWALHAATVANRPESAAVFLPGGRPPQAGERFRNVELAGSLMRIAEHGAAGLYDGPIATAIVSYLRDHGGLHTVDDLAAASGEYVEPISATYRGHRVHQCPPNGGGIAALTMLKILEGFDMAALDPRSAMRLHLEVEASKLAIADRDAHVCDPHQHGVPIPDMLSPDHIADLRSHIDPDRAIQQDGSSAIHVPRHEDTTYVCAIDGDRNAVSLISSVFGAFGSGLVPPRTGIVLQNRGLGFSTDRSHPNCIAGGKRPMHTIIPALVTSNGRATMVLGVVGGNYQPVGQCHVLTNIVDHAMDPQAAIDFPRAHHDEGAVVIERSYGRSMSASLGHLGHRTTLAREPIGGAQAIWIDEHRGCLVGASDRRKDGLALGWR
jgi:gamma-glutamyltranspeptidase/glutathione hydrolase